MEEIIKDLNECSDYLISNKGYIISKERTYNNGKSETAIKPEKILKVTGEGGYVSVITPERVIRKKLKDWVADNFLTIPTKFPKEFYSVFAKDGNESNASVDNLCYELNDTAVRAFDLEGNWLGDYAAPQDFIKISGSSLNSIYKACNGAQVTSDSYQFRNLKVNGHENHIKGLPSALNKRRSDTTPIAKYWDGRLVCVYNSITDAAESNEMTVEKVWESYERNKAIKGFTFKKI